MARECRSRRPLPQGARPAALRARTARHPAHGRSRRRTKGPGTRRRRRSRGRSRPTAARQATRSGPRPAETAGFRADSARADPASPYLPYRKRRPPSPHRAAGSRDRRRGAPATRAPRPARRSGRASGRFPAGKRDAPEPARSCRAPPDTAGISPGSRAVPRDRARITSPGNRNGRASHGRRWRARATRSGRGPCPCRPREP